MWKEVSIKKLAETLGVNIAEVREKQKLCALIAKARKSQKLSQANLARRLNVTQGRIAQIESGIGRSTQAVLKIRTDRKWFAAIRADLQ